MQNLISSVECIAASIKKRDKRVLGLFKEEFRCPETLCLCSKTYCCYDNKSNKFKFISEVLNKRVLEDSGDGPMSKYRRVLVKAVNFISTNRGFRTVNHMVARYEQTKKRLSYFYPKNKFEMIEIIQNHSTYGN